MPTPPPLEVGSKYICVEIGENGETKVEAVGFHGLGCREATRGLEMKLGIVAQRTEKPEIHEAQRIKTGS